MCHKFIRKFTGTQKAENAIPCAAIPARLSGRGGGRGYVYEIFARSPPCHCAPCGYQVTNEKLLYSLSVPVRTDLREASDRCWWHYEVFYGPTYFPRKKSTLSGVFLLIVVVVIKAHQCNIINSIVGMVMVAVKPLNTPETSDGGGGSNSLCEKECQFMAF